jgi:hypothetical protein
MFVDEILDKLERIEGQRINVAIDYTEQGAKKHDR